MRSTCVLVLFFVTSTLVADDAVNVWPDIAPGETAKDRGELLPPRDDGANAVQRVKNIRFPTLDVYPAEKPNGTGVLILPGGGFTYVVPNLEGSEGAEWLNQHGVTAFVLRYRTKESVKDGEEMWQRPLQDAQRSLRLIRSRAKEWNLDPKRVGVLGFSAGGQVAAILHTAEETATYKAIDEIDQLSCKPAFSMLVYPWRILDSKSNQLLQPIKVTRTTPPAFIVHTHDDGSTSVGAAMLYIAHKRNQVPAELHVYQNGGHGYGLRPRPNSVISSWPDRATEWMRIRGLIETEE
jgi:acetyl esterase/lipase